jgi:subtilisin family serine protease
MQHEPSQSPALQPQSQQQPQSANCWQQLATAQQELAVAQQHLAETRQRLAMAERQLATTDPTRSRQSKSGGPMASPVGLILTVSGKEGHSAIADLREFGPSLFQIQYVGELAELRLRGLDRAYSRARNLPHSYHLVGVPEEQALFAVNQIEERYDGEHGHGRIVGVEPNIVGEVTAPGPIDTPFTPGNDDPAYRLRMKLDKAPSSTDGSGVHVVVIDNGVDGAHGSYRDFFDVERTPAGPVSPTFTDGHGHAMATLIASVAKGAAISAVKVDDANGKITLWSLLTAVHIAALECEADIISMSIGLKNIPLKCPHCGASKTVRLRAYDQLLTDIAGLGVKAYGPPIYVAATGNDSKTTEFDFPASQAETLAVGSVNAGGARSSFTNYGAASHRWHVMAPGGEEASGTVTESVGQSANGNECFGTSPAAAYVSAVLALLRSEGRYQAMSTDAFLDQVKTDHCDPPPSGSSALEYGAGQIVYVKTAAQGGGGDDTPAEGEGDDSGLSWRAPEPIADFGDHILINGLRVPKSF